MRLFQFDTPTDAYLFLISEVSEAPEFVVTSRARETLEIADVIFSVKNPSSEPIVTHSEKINEIASRYTKREFQLYAAGTRSADKFTEAAKFWDTIKNPDGTINSAYGWLIWKDCSCGHPEFERKLGGKPVLRTPWEWAVQALLNDKFTRQAVVPFAKRDHLFVGNKDVTCTLHANFSIRNNKLNLSVVMRSNDLRRGLLYDLPWFCHLQDVMLGELLPTYPELVKGNYVHHAHSLHIYRDDLNDVKLMLGSELTAA